MINAKVTVDLRKLDYLRGSGSNKAIRIAFNRAAKPVKEAVIASVPTDSQNLQKSIRIKVKYYSNKRTWAAVVGPSTSFKRLKRRKPSKSRRKRGKLPTVRPARYAHLTQWGSKYLRGQHWVEAAQRRSQQQFLSILTNSLKQEFAKI